MESTDKKYSLALAPNNISKEINSNKNISFQNVILKNNNNNQNELSSSSF